MSTEPRRQLELDGFQLRLDREFPASLSSIDEIVGGVVELAACNHFDEEKQLAISLCLHESLVNAVVHGAGSDVSKMVRCIAAYDPARGILMIVRSPGEGFDPDAVPDCRDRENLYSTHGRGLRLMYHLMDSVEFRDGGSELRMIKS